MVVVAGAAAMKRKRRRQRMSASSAAAIAASTRGETRRGLGGVVGRHPVAAFLVSMDAIW